ncbi:MAG: 16S rRNA (guanine(966)-N(2))-methyltransferase RsmD [Candidatus Promineifilaceae bacterium]|nr:16S rRNA (guanine(966)-N(2))-methyltransferase RsmD [Candidatus Promineifilaceae bacterium]
MRVIGGSAKGHRLKRVPGDVTRPIMDRVKENLFNILGNWVVGTRWLDLFAGTGQVGIEALSRGAEQAIFVDSARAAIRTVHQNLASTRLAAKAVVIHDDAFSVLRRADHQPLDVVYVAPPQYQDIWLGVMAEIEKDPGTWLTADGMVIVQIDPNEFQQRNWHGLSIFDTRRYGRTMLCFYELEVGSGQ